MYNEPLARLLISRGATYDLTIASALNDLAALRSMLDTDPARISEQRPDDRRPLYAAADLGVSTSFACCWNAAPSQHGPMPTTPSAARPCTPRPWRGDREMVELLLEHGADPNGFVNASGNAVCAAKTPEIRKLFEAHGGFLDPYDRVPENTVYPNGLSGGESAPPRSARYAHRFGAFPRSHR